MESEGKGGWKEVVVVIGEINGVLKIGWAADIGAKIRGRSGGSSGEIFVEITHDLGVGEGDRHEVYAAYNV